MSKNYFFNPKAMRSSCSGPLTQWLARWLTLAEPGNGVAAELVNGGAASLLRLYELPQGRRYALLGPPQH